MTQEDKQLLLKDLGSRLFAHPMIYGKYGVTFNIGRLIFVTTSGVRIMTNGGDHHTYYLEEIKPYLRPMSSMTEEEKQEYVIAWDSRQPYLPTEAMDWLNAHHFDYRRLIDKGLALEAPEGMYK